MRHLEGAACGIDGRHAINAAVEDAQAARVSRYRSTLDAFREQQVQPQADAQKRHAGGDAGTDGVHLAQLVHGDDGVREGPDAGQHDGVRGCDLGGIVGYAGVAPDGAQTALDGEQVALLVVNDSDHKSLSNNR